MYDLLLITAVSSSNRAAFAASVFLNSDFLNTSYGKYVALVSLTLDGDTAEGNPLDSSTNNNNIVGETDEVFYFPEDALVEGQDNVITVVQVSPILRP